MVEATTPTMPSTTAATSLPAIGEYAAALHARQQLLFGQLVAFTEGRIAATSASTTTTTAGMGGSASCEPLECHRARTFVVVVVFFVDRRRGGVALVSTVIEGALAAAKTATAVVIKSTAPTTTASTNLAAKSEPTAAGLFSSTRQQD
jgi:hypothetical protein